MGKGFSKDTFLRFVGHLLMTNFNGIPPDMRWRRLKRRHDFSLRSPGATASSDESVDKCSFRLPETTKKTYGIDECLCGI